MLRTLNVEPRIVQEARVVVLGEGWYTDRPGGLNRYFAELLSAIRAQGLDARGAVIGPACGAPIFVERAGDADQPLAMRLWRFYQAAGRAGNGATVVDAHFALYALWPVILGPLQKLPLVVHFQGPWSEESRIQRDTSRLVVGIKHKVECAVYRRATSIVTLSGAFKRLLIEEYRVPPWLIEVVPPGVDLERFRTGDMREARSMLDLPQDARVIVAVRRLVPRMGFDVLLAAWAGMGTVSNLGVLAIVGEGPLRAELESLARELEIGSSVRFFERVDDTTLVRLYQSADLAVVPSVALEGFGLIVLEALACGTPVLVSDVGGLPEVMSPLDPNMVVPAADVSALAIRLKAVVAGTVALPDSGRCRRYAENFTWKRAALTHKTIYSGERARNRRLRVVYLDHCAELSGGEIVLLHLLPALRDIDAHVVLATDGPLVSKLIQAGISVEVLPMAEVARGLKRERAIPSRLPGSSVVASLSYVLHLAARLHLLRPDVVHTNSLKAALYGGIAARLAGVPVVWHLHDRISDDYLPPAAVRLVRSAARFLPAALIANSQSTCDTIGGTRRRVTIIWSPVGPEFALARAPVPRTTDGPIRIGMIGRLAPWKGQHLFVEAFSQAFGTGTEEAVIVGAALFGEAAYEVEVREKTLQLGVAARVEFRGFRGDIVAELATLDVVVHASTIPEPFGLVVAEAMAMGVAVVAPDVGGPAEMITDGVSGLLYPIGDIAALASAMSELAANPELRRRLGMGACERAQQFTPSVAARKVMEVYAAVVGRSIVRTRIKSALRHGFDFS